jgi:chemotaxis protein MotA
VKPEPKAPAPRSRRLDFASIAVLPAGVGVVLLAQMIEGGAARSLMQGPAALIVFGGTLAALLLSYSPSDVFRAVRAAAASFTKPESHAAALTASLVGYSIRAQRKGILALESELDSIDDPFLRHGLSLVVDDVTLDELKDVVAVERFARESDEDTPARVFDAAAGYAPTLGILGAVLGLIQVMEHLSQPGALGSGIAVAFVATIYGVGSANLLFLPIAGRLRERAAASARRREMIAEGLYAIHQRVSPRLVAQRLRAFAHDMPRVEEIAARVSAAPAPASRIPA